jgi:hypothetical protein
MEERLMRGRTPLGPEVVEELTGSEEAKQRVRVILETMAGQLRVHEACARLGISEQRLRQIRAAMLQAAVQGVEKHRPGRPRRPEELPEMVALRQQVDHLQEELELSRVREEVALVLPHVARSAAPVEAAQTETVPSVPAEDPTTVGEPAAPQKKRRNQH